MRASFIVAAAAGALLLVAALRSEAGTAPTGAPLFMGCLSYVSGSCTDGGGGNAGGFYSLPRLVGVNGWLIHCASSLSSSGMCTGSNSYSRYSTLVAGSWVVRDRTYVRTDGQLITTLNMTGSVYDSVGYASAGQWVVDMSELVTLGEIFMGLAVVIVFAIAVKGRGL